MGKKLFIDLDICTRCKECIGQCSYRYHHENNGITRLREIATMKVICRKCEDAPCIRSCPSNALQRLDDGLVHRSTILCTKCHSCIVACPFGTILPDTTTYLSHSCDLCVGRLEKEGVPLCVATCTVEDALQYGEFTEDPEKGIYKIDENLFVRATAWKKQVV